MLNNFIYAKKKSLFTEALNNGEVLDEAIVFIEDTKEIWNHGTYFDCSDKHITEENLNEVLSEYVTETELNNKGYLTEHQDISGKQDKLVSGTNIKTINGNDILGTGNLVIESGHSEANIQAINFGESVDDVEIDFALKDEIPTNVSQLNNDSGYITEERVGEMIEDAVIESGGVVVDKEIDADSSNPVTNEAIARALEAAVARGRELAKRDLYIAAGAEYNDTDSVIKKTAFWGAEVDHLPHHYYLNGLGDITEEEMEYIYQRKDDMTTFIAIGTTQGGRFWQNITDSRLRTLFGTNNHGRWVKDKSTPTTYAFGSCNIEVIKWTNTSSLAATEGPNLAMKTNAGLFFLNNKLKVVDRFMLNGDSDFAQAPNLEELRLWATDFNVTLSGNKKISKESIAFIITNVLKSTTKTLVITLHADTYAKCIEGGEWHEEVQSALDTANAAITGGGSINIASA